MKIKRRMAALLTAFTMCFSLSACGGKSEDSTQSAFSPRLDTEAEVTVNIVGTMQNFEALEAVINDFNEYYPNCDVVYTNIDDYYNTLQPLLESDDSTAIFMADSKLFRQGYLSDYAVNLLEEDIDFSAFADGVIDSNTSDGALYAVPLAHNTSGLIVNTTLLEDEGLSVPTNYSEFLEACETLKQKGYTPIQGAAYNSFVIVKNMYYMELATADNRDELIAALDSAEEGSCDGAEDAFAIIQELVDNGYIDNAVNETYADNYNDAILRFFEGDVPFLAATTETYSGMAKRETKSEHYSEDPFEYEFICAPVGEDGAYSYIENWSSFCVNKNCPNKEWAVEFMRFLCTEDELNQMSSVKGLPTVAANNHDERFDSLCSSDDEYTYVSDVYLSSTISNAFVEACEAIVTGKTDADGATKVMEEWLKE